MAQSYGAKADFRCGPLHHSFASVREPACPAAQSDEPHAPFAAQLCEQTLELIPRLGREDLLQLG